MIDSFRGDYDFLSNFYNAEVRIGRIVFPTSEHAYQYFKSMDIGYRNRILKCATPGEAKKLGKGIRLVPFWEHVKLGVMYFIVHEKFFQNPELARWLLDTKDEEIVEGNNWGDTTWGQVGGKGQNHLGKILMKVRKELRLCTFDGLNYIRDLSNESADTIDKTHKKLKKDGFL